MYEELGQARNYSTNQGKDACKIAQVIPREKEIPEKLSNLAYHADELISVANRLVNRLESVLRPEGTAGVEANTIPPNHTHLASQMDDVKERMIRANYVLSSALDRLEL